jgi:taurine dioxygenase
VSLADAALDDALLAEIRALWLKHRVLFFRDQDITRAEHVAFARRFGELEDHPVAGSDPTIPGLVRIYKTPDKPNDRYENAWHTDATWREKPPLGCVLRCVECPPVGGDTMWAKHGARYENLPQPIKEQVAGLRARHSIEASFGAAMPIEKRHSPEGSIPRCRSTGRAHPSGDAREGPLVNASRRTSPTSHAGQRALRPGPSRPAQASSSVPREPRRRSRVPGSLPLEPQQHRLLGHRSTQHYAVMDYAPCHRKMEARGSSATPLTDFRTNPRKGRA